MPAIAETVTELIQWVFPEHAGAPGQIHGGRMMQWIAQAGTMAAARVAHGTVVLGAMDDIDFLHPVKVGQIPLERSGLSPQASRHTSCDPSCRMRVTPPRQSET